MTTGLSIETKQTLLASYDIGTDLGIMEDASAAIKAASLGRAEIIRALPHLDEQLGELEARYLLEIATQIDEKTGKPVYSNAESRKAALLREMRGDDSYQVLTSQKEVLQRQADTLQVNIDAQQRRYNLARYRVEWNLAGIKLLAS